MAVPACHAASVRPLLGEGGAAAIASSAQSRLPLAEAGSVAGMAAAAARGRVLCLFDVDGTLTPARQVARHGGVERWGGETEVSMAELVPPAAASPAASPPENRAGGGRVPARAA